MKIELLEKKIVSSHDFESARCTIDAEDMKYIASLLRNNYSNPILATIREVYANAVDANAENGLDASSIVVSMPTSLNPNFEIRDYGKGLSRHDMFNLYTKYGKSTKRNDDKNIGGFGIGRLAPLSYSNDGFSITSFHNGEKRIYSLYIKLLLGILVVHETQRSYVDLVASYIVRCLYCIVYLVLVTRMDQ